MKKVFFVFIFFLILFAGYKYLITPQSQNPPKVLEVVIVPTKAPNQQNSITTPSNPQPAQKIRLAVTGDFGDPTGPVVSVANQLANWNPEAVITTGDNNYPSGNMVDFSTHTYAHYGKFIDAGTFFPALGNHDWGYPAANSYTADTLPHSQYFSYLPGNRRYYDVLLGGGLVHVFVLDSDYREPDGRTQDSSQAQWLKTTMEKSPAAYKLVFLHESPFSSCKYGDIQAVQWPFKVWGADAVFSGHCHYYERLEVDGLTYIVNGIGGGGGVYDFASISPYSLYRNNKTHGFNIVDVYPDYLQISFVSVTGEVLDTHIIK